MQWLVNGIKAELAACYVMFTCCVFSVTVGTQFPEVDVEVGTSSEGIPVEMPSKRRKLKPKGSPARALCKNRLGVIVCFVF